MTEIIVNRPESLSSDQSQDQSSDDEGLSVIELDSQSPIGDELRMSPSPSQITSFSGSDHDRYIIQNLPWLDPDNRTL